jgi:hypothetical protein
MFRSRTCQTFDRRRAANPHYHPQAHTRGQQAVTLCATQRTPACTEPARSRREHIHRVGRHRADPGRGGSPGVGFAGAIGDDDPPQRCGVVAGSASLNMRWATTMRPSPTGAVLVEPGEIGTVVAQVDYV